MYVAVKGGREAIANAHALLEKTRRGDPSIPELSTTQIREQLSLGVSRVMTEGSLYDPELAALAIKQAQGDMVEAIFLLRAFRTTLPRFGSTRPVDTGAMRVRRRISATYKDLPGGQVLGPTYDYTHRLLDADLERAGSADAPRAVEQSREAEEKKILSSCGGQTLYPRVSTMLEAEGLMEEESATEGNPVGDLTRESLGFPAGRDIRLQNLARADEGFILALAYSTQRGFGSSHPFAGELRLGEVDLYIEPEELGFPMCIGSIPVTECESVNQFKGGHGKPPQFTRGYGLAFGYCERKAMSMALVDRALRAAEFGEEIKGPAQDEEFVLYHSDNVEASGFTQHLKLPHYVDFQAELALVRSLRGASEEEKEAVRHE